MIIRIAMNSQREQGISRTVLSTFIAYSGSHTPDDLQHQGTHSISMRYTGPSDIIDIQSPQEKVGIYSDAGSINFKSVVVGEAV